MAAQCSLGGNAAAHHGGLVGVRVDLWSHTTGLRGPLGGVVHP